MNGVTMNILKRLYRRFIERRITVDSDKMRKDWQEKEAFAKQDKKARSHLRPPL